MSDSPAELVGAGVAEGWADVDVGRRTGICGTTFTALPLSTLAAAAGPAADGSVDALAVTAMGIAGPAEASCEATMGSGFPTGG